MPAPQLIIDLVNRFQRLETTGKLPSYNESSTRNEFIDRFFEALGWDVRNERGEREVVLEEIKRDKNQTLRPDYTFQLPAQGKFFVEAKRPSVVLQNDQNAAFQLRRYGYSAGLALSILTNFAHLAIYDCRIQPNEHDHPEAARYRFYTYQQYLTKWDEIVALFSREAVFNGSLNQFETTNKPKRGAIPIEKAFLQEISKWREYLAHGFFAVNKGLSQEDLNFAVQMTINRLLFLRICEDHGIEPYRSLQKLLPEQASASENEHSIYPKLCLRFQEADLRYNAGLFHFGPQKGRPSARDTLTLNLRIHNESLQKIIEGLDPELCPYAFQVIPVEILGQIYEQFLGKVIIMTDKGLAIEDKPEVRKAGGVYYTPQYIVDYIVRQTIGPLLADQTPETIANLTILDPACGSGSFLLGAYRYLLAWYEQWYQENAAEKWQNQGLLVQKKGEWRISRKKRSEILCDHIFGVDKDAQAVEVAKFSLFLKYLEEETEEVIKTTPHSLLPDLDGNLKCGNSLIGPDFKATESAEIQQINPFAWETEFPKIMQAGGFDVVLGNPPYVRQEALVNTKSYFQANYRVYHGVADLYTYFIERGVNLLKPNGMFGYIVANKWFRANYAEALRKWLKEQSLQELIDFGDLPVFQGATTYPCILILRKAGPQPTFFFAQAKTLAFNSLQEHIAQEKYPIQQIDLNDKGWALKPDQTQLLIAKLQKVGVLLQEYIQDVVYRGVTTGLNTAFVIDNKTCERLIEEDMKSADLIKPFLAGRDIKRYHIPQSTKYLIFTRRGVNISDYPAIKKHLTAFKEHLMPKPEDWKGDQWLGRKPGRYEWYEIQDSTDYYEEFEKPKIMLPDISLRGNFAFDAEGKSYCANTAYIIASSDKYLLGILNSKLITFYYSNLAATYRGGYLRFINQYLVQIPIRTINFADPQEKAQHDQLVSLVEKQLELHQKLAVAQTPHQKTLLERQINETDKAIDSLVYELYGLNAAEIALIEAATL